jgi:hypothetical protein
MDAEQYAKFAEQTKSMAHRVLVAKKPAGLSPAARYGCNFVVGADGAIFDTWAGSGETTVRVTKALAAR